MPAFLFALLKGIPNIRSGIKKKMSRYTKSASEGHFCLYRVVKRRETLHITFYMILNHCNLNTQQKTSNIHLRNKMWREKGLNPKKHLTYHNDKRQEYLFLWF